MNTYTRRILNGKSGRTGYIRVFQRNSNKSVALHRLIAHTFLGAPTDPKMVVNHKDENVKNNAIENLEWVTQSQNMQAHADLRTENDIIVGTVVHQYDLDGSFIRTFPNMLTAYKHIGGTGSSHKIGEYVKKIGEQRYGYQWRTEKVENCGIATISILKKFPELKVCLEKMEEIDCDRIRKILCSDLSPITKFDVNGQIEAVYISTTIAHQKTTQNKKSTGSNISDAVSNSKPYNGYFYRKSLYNDLIGLTSEVEKPYEYLEKTFTDIDFTRSIDWDILRIVLKSNTDYSSLRQVWQIGTNGKRIKKHPSVRDAERSVEEGRSKVSQIKRLKRDRMWRLHLGNRRCLR